MSRRNRLKTPSPLLLLTPVLVSAFVLQAAPATAQATDVNHASNGSFEGGRTGWEAGTADTTLRVVRVGQHKVAQLTTPRRRAGVVLSDRPSAFRVGAEGERLVASAWARTSGRPLNARLVVAQTKPGVTGSYTARTFRLTSEWKRLSVAATTASAGSRVEVRLRANNLVRGQHVRVDKVRIMGRAGVAAPSVAAALAVVAPVTQVSATSSPTTIAIKWAVTPNGNKVSGVYVGRNGTSVGGTNPYESKLIAGLTGQFTFQNLRTGTPYTVYAQPVVNGVRGKKTFLTLSTKVVEPVTSVSASTSGSTATLNWTVTPNGRSVSGVVVGRDGTSLTGTTPFESSEIAGLSGSFTFKNLRSATDYNLSVQPVVDGVRGAKSSVKVTTVAASAPLAIGGAYLSNADPSPVELRSGAKFQTSRTYWTSGQVSSAVARVKADMAAGRSVSQISFKLPHSWALMATGSGDAWAKDLASRLEAAVAGSDHLVRISMHHEPENDTGTNAANTTAGRDAWKAMQARLAPFFDKPGIEYIIVLMGYHSFSPSSNLYNLWKLDACIPAIPAIKGIGYDIYESYGSSGSKTWKNWDSYFSQIKAFHEPRHLTWGLSEVGVTDAAIAANPQWFSQQITKMKASGGTWFDYFNTNLNSVSPWYMDPNSAREQAFSRALFAN